MTNHETEEFTRMQRRRRSRLLQRVALAVGLVALVGMLVGGGYYAWQLRQEQATQPPAKLVVIAESELEDGTTVAGAVAIVTPGADELFEPVDTLAPAAIPGTSYDRLRDALSLGGPELVAKLAAGSDPDVGWLLLDEATWSSFMDELGGASVVVLDGGTTVFTGEKLFRFSKGRNALTGEEAVALLRGSEMLSGKGSGADAREQLARGIAGAAIADAQRTADAVKDGRAESSESPGTLAAFIRGVDR